MKTAKIEIGGKEYFLTINNRVLKTFEDRGIKLDESIAGEAPVTRIVEIFCILSDAGARYAKKMGLGNYEAISEDDLLDLTGLDDFGNLVDVFTELAVGERTVDAELPAGKEEAVQTARMN